MKVGSGVGVGVGAGVSVGIGLWVGPGVFTPMLCVTAVVAGETSGCCAVAFGSSSAVQASPINPNKITSQATNAAFIAASVSRVGAWTQNP